MAYNFSKAIFGRGHPGPKCQAVAEAVNGTQWQRCRKGNYKSAVSTAVDLLGTFEN